MPPLRPMLVALALAAVAACDEPRRSLPPGATAPLFADLGEHGMPITTSIPLAQRYFDQGLVLAYGFNHDEALRSFREAQRLDPACAACFWGEAYVLGPNINRAMDPDDAPTAWRALESARERAPGAGALERALIAALGARYRPEPGAERASLDQAYADAMRAVAAAHPDHPDVLALYAEAQLDTSPWDYTDERGETRPRIAEAIAALERALAIAPDHPGANHFLIHAVEEQAPGRAEAAADRLRDLVPGAGHLVHMPSHVYLRLGRYEDASLANLKAAEADESYISQCRAQGFYPSNYYPHNIDFLIASSTFEGRSGQALDAARKLARMTPAEAVLEFPNVEEFMPRLLFAQVRFGRWREVLAAPEPGPGLPYLEGAWHFARGMAFAARGAAADARRELGALEAARAAARPDARTFLSGATPGALLGIAVEVLAARLASEGRDHGAAIAALRRAAALESALPYAEPPPWPLPARDALGQALLDAGRPAEAEAAFREQLAITPESGWSLSGLARSLRAQGRPAEAEAVERRFAKAWRRADVELARSVF